MFIIDLVLGPVLAPALVSQFLKWAKMLCGTGEPVGPRPKVRVTLLDAALFLSIVYFCGSVGKYIGLSDAVLTGSLSPLTAFPCLGEHLLGATLNKALNNSVTLQVAGEFSSRSQGNRVTSRVWSLLFFFFPLTVFKFLWLLGQGL